MPPGTAKDYSHKVAQYCNPASYYLFCSSRLWFTVLGTQINIVNVGFIHILSLQVHSIGQEL